MEIDSTVATTLNIPVSPIGWIRCRWKVHGATTYHPQSGFMTYSQTNDKEGKREASSHLKRVAG